jgi:hypothetical protein
MLEASNIDPRSIPPPPRHTLFLPLLILLIGSGAFALYQVIAMQDQLDEATYAIDQMDGKVKRAQYEKAKFYAIANDVLRLAPKDANADQVAVYFNLRQLQAAQPELLSSSAPSDMAVANAAPGQPAAATNFAPAQPSQATNVAPAPSPGPAAK